MLGIPYIGTMGVLTINYETIGRHLASHDNADKKDEKLTKEKEQFKQKVGSLRAAQQEAGC